jgi:hypothetical protein
MTTPEDHRRLEDVRREAEEDGLKPNEFIQREIRGAIQRQNPFIKAGDPFVVLGFDGFDRSIFPVGSFQTPEKALKYAEEKRSEEHLYSSDPEYDIASRFQTYTTDGILVRPPGETS